MTYLQSEYNNNRKRRNDRTHLNAINNGKPWTDDETELLGTWSGTESELLVMADILGRTAESCRQRFNLLFRPHEEITTTTTTTTTTTRVRWHDEGYQEGWYVN